MANPHDGIITVQYLPYKAHMYSISLVLLFYIVRTTVEGVKLGISRRSWESLTDKKRERVGTNLRQQLKGTGGMISSYVGFSTVGSFPTIRCVR